MRGRRSRRAQSGRGAESHAWGRLVGGRSVSTKPSRYSWTVTDRTWRSALGGNHFRVATQSLLIAGDNEAQIGGWETAAPNGATLKGAAVSQPPINYKTARVRATKALSGAPEPFSQNTLAAR